MVRRGLAILRVEIEAVGRKRLGVCLNVDVEVEGINPLFAVVANGNASVLLKRHWEEAVESFVGADAERHRLPYKIVAEAESEEIAEGSFDAGGGFTVP